MGGVVVGFVSIREEQGVVIDGTTARYLKRPATFPSAACTYGGHSKGGMSSRLEVLGETCPGDRISMTQPNIRLW